jgi:5-hydroxyisourate hydrolase-like protein (transthyretin family)
MVLFVAAGGLLTSLQLTRAESPAVSESTSLSLDDEKKDSVAENDDQQKPVEHSGVVSDADTGKPIAGVTVTVTRMESYDWQELAISKSLTDENGRYTFTIPADQLKQPLLYILFDIDHPQYAQQHCGSYSYGMIADNLKNGEQPWFSDLKMVRGEKISGRLVDEQNRPVAGAQIRCVSKPKSNRHQQRTVSVAGQCFGQGRSI